MEPHALRYSRTTNRQGERRVLGEAPSFAEDAIVLERRMPVQGERGGRGEARSIAEKTNHRGAETQSTDTERMQPPMADALRATHGERSYSTSGKMMKSVPVPRFRIASCTS